MTLLTSDAQTGQEVRGLPTPGSGETHPACGHLPDVAVLGVTSLSSREAAPQHLATYVRGHWSIEVRHEVALCE
jgi:hypothetical protein